MWGICLPPPAAVLPSVSSVNKQDLETKPVSAAWLKLAPKEGLASSVNAEI